MKPLLSVAIATKNREKYCIEALKSLLNFKNQQLEITVADNSDSTLVKDFIEEIKSPFIKYQYDPGPVSSIENFNRAVGLATGEYVMLIGDDDSILPKAFEIVAWAKDNKVDSVCSKENLIYYWPNVLKKYPDGVMMVPKSTGKISKIEIRKNLEKLVGNGLQLYLLFPLPRTYHGIVRRELMEEIKRRTGHYYGGLSPDLYSSIAVSCVADNHYVIDEPLSIAGVCATSTTADNFKGKHSGTLEGIPHLKHRSGYEFSDKIPLYYSVNTIWAESGLKALEELGETELLRKFNMYHLMAQAWIHNNKFIPKIIREKHQDLLAKHGKSQFEARTGIFTSNFKIYGDKFVREVKAVFQKNKPLEYTGLKNLIEVSEKYKTVRE